MLKIGITGGIGSGKSSISHIFKSLGIPTYCADDRAKMLMDTNRELIEKIIKFFGKISYNQNTINRSYISSQVFDNKPKLKLLNSLVHPVVEEDFSLWCNEYASYKYVIKEAAILYESGSYKHLDKTIVVAAPTKLRIERVMKRDKSSKSEIEKRIINQWPTEKLLSLADFSIINDGNKLILPQIIKIDKTIKDIWLSLENG